jgi:hypothetical protein
MKIRTDKRLREENLRLKDLLTKLLRDQRLREENLRLKDLVTRAKTNLK